jgi:hypothetical protein
LKKLFFIFMLLAMPVVVIHMASAQQPGNGSGTETKKQSAKENHSDYAGMKVAECNECHKGEGIAPNHDADWVRGHRVLASKAGSNCSQCHKQSDCLDCHSGGGIDSDLSTRNYRNDYVPRSHRTDFITIHPIKALDNPQTCNRCHEPSYCNQCHSRYPKGSLRIKSHLMLGPDGQRYAPALTDHAIEARRNLQSCQACHPEGDVCIQCHSAKSGGTNPHPRNWDRIKNNYRDRAGVRTCIKCHLPGDPKIN